MRDIPPELLDTPFTRSRAFALGVTPRQLRGSRFVQVLHGVHMVRGLELTLDRRTLAVSLILPPGAVVAGETGAWLHGADVRRPGDLAVDVLAVRLDQVRRRGIRCREGHTDPDDIVVLNGVPVLSPTRIAFDLARRDDLVEAVVGLDAMLNRGGAKADELATYIERHPKWRGVRYAEETLAFAEPLSQSPMESRQRMALVLAGLPRPEAQIELFEGGVLQAAIDNGYRPFRVGADYDGVVHEGTWHRDSDRSQWIEDQDWWHRRYNSSHYRAGWYAMNRQVHAALRSRGWRRGDLPECPPANPRRVRRPYGVPVVS